MQRIGEPDRADEFDGMTVDEYAEHRGLQIANSRRKGRKAMMTTKNELQEQLDSAAAVLNAVSENSGKWRPRRTSEPSIC